MLLAVNQLSKSFKQHTAVDQVSLKIEPNQCVALLGPNGAGKTTTLNMLAGLLTPTSGTIAFMGKNQVDRKEIGYLPQYPAFFNWMTAKEYLLFAGKLSHYPVHELKDKIDDMLEFVDLQDARNKKIAGFSGGMRQRLGLAQAMLHEPKLLILDEPVSALDPAGRRDVLAMMFELKKKMAILFSTHVLHDAEQVCDEIVMLKSGQVRWSGTLAELRGRDIEETFILQTSEKLAGFLTERPYVKEYHARTPYEADIQLHDSNDQRRLLEDCLQHELTIIRFEKKVKSLEDAYMEVLQQ